MIVYDNSNLGLGKTGESESVSIFIGILISIKCFIKNLIKYKVV